MGYTFITKPEDINTSTPELPTKNPISEDIKPSELEKDSLPYKFITEAPKSLNPTSIVGETIKQSKYDLDAPRFSDLDELRGERQSNWDKWGNGITKMAGIATTTAGEPLVALFYGLPKALMSPFDHDPETGFHSIFDNEMTRKLDKFNDNLRTTFPTYYNQAELQKGLLGEMGTANFWSDKVLNGVGFTLGSIASAMATGGIMTELTGLNRGNSLINSLAKMTTAEKEAYLVTAGVETLNDLKSAAQSVKFKEGLTSGVTNLVAAHVEAGMEGRQGSQQYYDDEIKKIIDQGRTPTQEEIDDINKNSYALENTRYLMNLPVVYGANAIEFGKVLSKRFETEVQGLTRAEQRRALDLAEGIVTKPLTKSERVFNVIKNPFAEAGQELTQNIIQEGLNDYFDRRFNGKNQDTLNNMIESLGTGMKNTFGTNDGLEQGLIGAIIGVIGAPIPGHFAGGIKEGIAENKEKAERIQAAAKSLQNYKLSDSYAPLFEAGTAALEHQNRSDEAVKAGDIFEYNNEKANKFYSYVNSRIQTGQFERMMDEFSSYDQMSDDEFKKTFFPELEKSGQPLPKDARQFLTSLKNKTQELNQIHNQIDVSFPHLNDATRDILKFSSFRISDIDKRETELDKKIFEETGIDYKTLKKEKPTSYREELVSQFNKIRNTINPGKVPSIEGSIMDIQKLSIEREKFLHLFHFSAKAEQAIIEAKQQAKEKGDKEVQNIQEEKKTTETKKKVATQEVQDFYTEHKDHGFNQVEIPEMDYGPKDSKQSPKPKVDENGNPVTKKVNLVGFAKNKDGEVNPNSLVSDTGTEYSTSFVMPFIKPEHVYTLVDAQVEKTLNERISAIQAVINEDIEKGIQNRKKIQEAEEMLLETLIEIEDLEKYKQGKDSKFRQTGVKGSKVYTEVEYRKVLSSLTNLKEQLESDIQKYHSIRNELVTNIKFLRERQKATQQQLVNHKALLKVTLKTLPEQSEIALQKLIDSDGTSIQELEELLKDSSEMIDRSQKDIDIISEYINTLTKILKRNDLETLARTRNVLDSNFKAKYPLAQGFLFRLQNQETLSIKQRQVLSTELQKYSERFHGFKEDLENLSRIKSDIEEQKMRQEEISLAQSELEELQKLNSEYKKFQREYKQFLDASKFLKNYTRLQEALTKVQSGLITEKGKLKTPSKTKKKAAGGLSEPSEATPEEWEDIYQKKARRDYKDVLNGSAGSNTIGDTDAITTDEEQQRYFKTTEGIVISPDENYSFRFITKENNPFGDRVKFDEGFDNIIQCVLYKDGKPFEVDGKLIYTRAHETPDIHQISKNESARYNNKSNSTQEQIEKELQDYTNNFRNVILAHTNKEEGLYSQVLGKSKGIQVGNKGENIGPVLNRISPSEKDISKIDLVVALENTTMIQGQVIETPRKGLVLIGHKGQVIPVKLAKLSQIPGAVDRVMQLIEDYSTSKDPKSIETLLKKIIFYGDHSGAVHKIYFTKDGKQLFFKDKFYPIDKIDKDALRVFLENKFLNVNTQYLKDNKKFIDPIKKNADGKTYKSWPSYKHFLMSSEGRTDEEIPIKVDLSPLDQQQFLNIYLKFDSTKLSTDSTPKIKLSEVTLEEKKETEEPKVQPKKEIKKETQKETKRSSKIEESDEDLIEQFAQAKAAGVVKNVKETDQTTVEDKEPDQEQMEKNLAAFLAKKSAEDLNRLYQGEQPASKEELDLEEKWFKETFPKFESLYSRVKGLIDGRAVGQLTEQGRILISRLAAPGTTYHEAFHVVTQMLMTKEERESLYKESGKTEEELAEDFRGFMLSGGKTEVSKETRNWFQKLIDWVKEFFLGKTNGKDNIQLLFENIAQGKFANKDILQLPSQRFNRNHLKQSSEYHTQAMELITSEFFNYLLDPRTGTSINSLTKLNRQGFNNLFNEVKERIQSGYRRNFNSEGVPNDVKMSSAEWNKLSFKEKKNKSAIVNSFENHNELWKNWNSAILDFKNYLKQYRIDLVSTSDLDEEDFDIRDSRDSGDYIESVKFSSKDGAPDIVKLLIATLPRYTGDKVSMGNIFYGPQLANYERNMNTLHNELAGLRTFSELITKIKSLANSTPEFNLLLERLGVTLNENTPSILSWDKINLQLAFERQFVKTKNISRKMLVDENGNIYSVDNDEEYLKDQIRNLWKGSKISTIYKVQNGKVVFNKEIILGSSLKFDGKKYDPNNINNVLKMLHLMGINFTDQNFSQEEIKTIIESTRKIIEYVVKNPEVNSLFSTKNANSSLEKLLQIEMAKKVDQIELQHIGPDGETRYGITLNNYLSSIVNKINTQGIQSLEHLKHDLYSENSIWKSILSNNKNAIKVSVSEGMQQKKPGEEGKITSKLQPGDLVVQHLNNILNNRFPFMQMGDRRMSYMLEINMNNELDFENEGYLKVLGNYLKDEINKVQNREYGEDIMFFNKNSINLGVFDYLSLELKKKIQNLSSTNEINTFVNSKGVQDEIKNYLESLVKENISLLEKYKVVDKVNDWYKNNGIDKTIAQRFAQNSTRLNEKELERLVKEVTIKYLVSNIEQTKLFSGSLDFFNHEKQEAPKRMHSIGSTKDMASIDPGIQAWFSQQGEQLDNKNLDNTFRVVTFDEVLDSADAFIKKTASLLGIKEEDSYFNDYRNIKVVDGQGYITLPEYRRFMFRMGNWNQVKEDSFKKAMKGEKVDKTLFQPLKPQYYGPQEAAFLYVPSNLKLSLLPLIPNMIKGTPMEDLNNHLMEQGIGISVFPSGHKIGAKVNLETLKPQKLFDNKGEVIKNDTLTTSTLYYEYFGTQLDIKEKPSNQNLTGTQFRKQILSNLFNNGEGKIIQVHNALTGELENRDTTEIVKEWRDIVSELTKLEKQDLFKRFHIQPGDKNSYKITDMNKFKQLVYEEALDRDLADNLLDGIEYSLSGENPSLDVLVNKQKVENILNALVNNNLIKQKTFGSMKVLASSTGMTLKAEKDSSLKFYENGVMEVKLPSYFKEFFKNAALEDIDSKLLNLIGYRIPTQGLASIENIKVVGFLDDSAGDVILVPQAYPAKSGGDYDIDKLNLLFPNFNVNYLDSKGKDLEGSQELIDSINQKLRNKYSFKQDIDFKEILLKDFDDLDKVLNTDYDKMSEVEQDISRYYNQILSSANKSLSYIPGGTHTKKALQNRMIELSREILSSPNKAKELFTTNSTKHLKTLVTEIRKINNIPTQDKDAYKLVEFAKQLKIAQDFWSGKQGVGITALHSTGHILSQIVNLYIQDENTYINLPHNTVLDNKISLSGEYDRTGVKGNRISDIISEFLNGYVDISKDPFIFDLNAGINNANTWLYLLRAGVPLNTIGYFMSQPIVKDYLETLNINSAEFLKAANEEDTKNQVQKEIFKKYSGGKESEKAFTSSVLKSYLENPDFKNKTFLGDQTRILEDFLHYSETAEKLSALQQSISYDTKGVGKTRWAARASFERFNQIKEQEFFGNADRFITETLLQPFHQVVQASTSLFNELYISDDPDVSYLMNNLFKEFNSIDKGLRPDQIGEIMDYAENELITYLLQVIPLEKTSFNTQIKRLMLDEKSLPIRVKNLMNNPLYKENQFLQQLLPLINEDRSKPDNVKLFSRILNTYQSNQVTQDFLKLKGVKDDQGEIYKDLITLAILQSGLNYSPINFIHIIPNSDFVRVAKQILKVNLSASNVNLKSFLTQFYQNNYWKNDIVPYYNATYFSEFGRKSNLINNNTQLVVYKLSQSAKYQFVKTYIEDPSLSEEERNAKKVQGINTKIPKLFQKTQQVKGKSIIYQEVPILGDRFSLKEYYLDENKPSVIENNRLKTTKIIRTRDQEESKITGITKEDALKTFDFGDKEGTPQNTKTNALVHRNIIETPDKPMYDEGESFNEAFERVIPSIKDIIKDSPDNTVIVTHNSVYGLINLWAKEGRPDSFTKAQRIKYSKQDEDFSTGEKFSLKTPKGNIIIIRHGETEDNVKKVFRTSEARLTQKGIKEAEKLGEELSKIKIPQVISSPLDRAIQTSKIILEKQSTKGNTQIDEKFFSNIEESIKRRGDKYIQNVFKEFKVNSFEKLQSKITEAVKMGVSQEAIIEQLKKCF